MLVYLLGYLDPHVGSSWAWLTVGNHALMWIGNVNWLSGLSANNDNISRMLSCIMKYYKLFVINISLFLRKNVLRPLFTRKSFEIVPFSINAKTHTHMKLITQCCVITSTNTSSWLQQPELTLRPPPHHPPDLPAAGIHHIHTCLRLWHHKFFTVTLNVDREHLSRPGTALES